MQNLCHLSRRWHRQFCCSPGLAERWLRIAQWQSVRHYRQRTVRRPPTSNRPSPKPPVATPTLDTGDLVVREYEQNELDPNDRRPLNPQDDPFTYEEDAIRAEIEQLDKELEIMKQGPFAPNSSFMRSLPKNERETLLRDIEASGIGQNTLDDLIADEELDADEAEEESEGRSKPVEVTLRIPFQQKVYVKQFNVALKELNEDSSELKCHLNLWKWYLRCQQKVANFSSVVPEEVWDVLWNSQIKTYPCTRHIVVLARDMTAAGNGLTTRQFLDYIDALDKTGETTIALTDWEQEKDRIGFIKEANVADRFWTTGVRLYASVGRPKKAENVALAALEAGHVDPNIFIPVIDAWAKTNKQDAALKIWSSYLRMKACLKSSNLAHNGASGCNPTLPVDVLGYVSSTLLKNGHRDLAQAVFRDMLATHSRMGMDSFQIYTESLKKFTNIENSTPTEETINEIGLTALTTVPKYFRNKFFFAAWIKWLLGEGKVEDAELVVELMQEYNVKPDAHVLNGIIGAWLRTCKRESQEKAEQMAWAMVHARLEQVGASHAVVDFMRNNKSSHYANKRWILQNLQRRIPSATLETFSILLHMYTSRGDVEKATHLTNILEGHARLKPNSFILNHWLNLSLRVGDLTSLWQRYVSTKDEITCDVHTFIALWNGMHKNLERTHRIHTRDYPEPRKLFKEMQQWIEKLSQDKAQSAKTDFSPELYEQIIRCFCLYDDLPGIFVAVHAMNDVFGALPSEDVTRMVLMQVARTLPAVRTRSRRPRQPAFMGRVDPYRSSLSQLANVMQNISDHEGVKAIDNGATVAELEEPDTLVSQMVRLRSVQLFVCMVMKRKLRGDQRVSSDTVNAALGMNVKLTAQDAKPFIDEMEEYEKRGGGLPSSSDSVQAGFER